MTATNSSSLSRPRVLVALALAFALPATVSAINPENLNTISFSNKTGYDIWYLYLSPGDSSLWGTDILGAENTLDSGGKLDFYIHYPDACNTFDIMAVDSYDDAYIVSDFEICDDVPASVSFTTKNEVSGAPEFDLIEVQLTNETGFELWYLFMSPEDSQMWGVDQMDSGTTLGTGKTISLLVHDSGSIFDVHAVDSDDDSYTLQVDLGAQVGGELQVAIEFDDIDL